MDEEDVVEWLQGLATRSSVLLRHLRSGFWRTTVDAAASSRSDANASLHIAADMRKCVPLPGATLSAQQDAALEYLCNDVHSHFIRDIAAQAAVELGRWTTWLNSRDSARQSKLQVDFCDGLEFGADATPPRAGDPTETYKIRISLGSLRYLLAAANRVVLGETLGGGGDYLLFEAISSWEPFTDLIGCLWLEKVGDSRGLQTTARRVIDALAIMLLHEAAHVRIGHLSNPRWQANSKNWRAAESDADNCAGWGFINGLAQVQGTTSFDPNDVRRLHGAALTNYIAAQITLLSPRSRKYHLPRTRLFCTELGGEAAWIEAGGRVDVFRIARDRYDGRIWEALSLMSDHLKNWIGLEESDSDQLELQSVTMPLAAQLRALDAGSPPAGGPSPLNPKNRM
jgi:hypothetical protein